MGCDSSKVSGGLGRTISFVGLDNSGKSQIVYYLANNKSIDGYVAFSTPGVSFHEIPASDSTVQIFDLGGLGRYRDQWKIYLQQSDGIVFVIDRTDKDRVYCVKEEIQIIFQICFEKQIPLLIFLNKSDIDKSVKPENIKQILEIDKKNLIYNIVECSAQTGEGIILGRDWILQNLKYD